MRKAPWAKLVKLENAGSDVAVQRCTVHKHQNLLAHAPERLREEYRTAARIRSKPARSRRLRR
ncbi:MAG: hypothetical protein DLM68_05470 [Hyphomicrobiales bacterium]|nr:MAG: hypothetical protein DLM68_05470 [Hyphomicrobiales bacterium]